MSALRPSRNAPESGPMPNSFAFLILFSWPVLAFMAFRRLPLAMSVSAAVIGAQLLLPPETGIDLPMLPAFDKALSGTLAALLLIAVALNQRRPLSAGTGQPEGVLPGWVPRSRAMQLCLLGVFASSVVTVYLNGETLTYGPRILAGLQTYDVFNATLSQMMVILPFLIARKVLATAEAQKMFLIVLAVSGVLYILPILYEVRMSPQLNSKFYGFFPASFLQHVRMGGYRPIVFFEHGLRLSLFLALAFLASLACVRLVRPQYRTRFILATAGLFGALVISKSLGALMIALILAPVMFLAPLRIKLLVAAGITAVTLIYPVLRGNNLAPVDQLVELVHNIDEERAGSLKFRLTQEDILLEKATEKPLFGWGGWGRARVYNHYGADVSVTDGAWVILFGTGGWAKYITTFGMLGLPVLLLALRRKTLRPEESTAAIALLLAGNMIDLIPNSGLLPLTWMMAGALAGRLEYQTAAATDAAAEAEAVEQEAAHLFSPGLRERALRMPAGKEAFARPESSGMKKLNAAPPVEPVGNPYAPKLSKPRKRDA